MKNKYVIIVFSFLVIAIFLLLICNNFFLNYYKTDSFSVYYDNKWKAVEKEKNNLVLKMNNDSYIDISASSVIKSDDKKDIYYNINKQFIEDNPNYKLINKGDIKVGEKYYDSFEFLYENEAFQSLLIITIVKNKVIRINFTSIHQYYDFYINDFYDVINSFVVI